MLLVLVDRKTRSSETGRETDKQTEEIGQTDRERNGFCVFVCILCVSAGMGVQFVTISCKASDPINTCFGTPVAMMTGSA